MGRQSRAVAKEKALQRTKVIFRVFEGEIIALFPEDPATLDYGDCTSYMHVGQHGAANPRHVMNSSRPATPDEYASLKDELEKIGYALDIRQRYTSAMHQACERARRSA